MPGSDHNVDVPLGRVIKNYKYYRFFIVDYNPGLRPKRSILKSSRHIRNRFYRYVKNYIDFVTGIFL